MYRLVQTSYFERRLRRFLRSHPDLVGRLERTLDDLQAEPHPPRLRLHPLQGELEGRHAAWVAPDCRVVVEIRTEEKRVVLLSIGRHDGSTAPINGRAYRAAST